MIGSNGRCYDEDYFERGIATGKSCYENYRCIPELTIPMAMTIIDVLKIGRDASVLDFGCAKGYLVKALRLLYRQAWGLDASDYALKHLDNCVKDYCFHWRLEEYLPKEFDFCIAKDVFEHLYEDDVVDALKWMSAKTETIFAVIPLGEDGKYRVPVNNLDVTHRTKETEEWWINLFRRCGWEIRFWTFRIEGIKDHYKDYPNGHGFFYIEKC